VRQRAVDVDVLGFATQRKQAEAVHSQAQHHDDQDLVGIDRDRVQEAVVGLDADAEKHEADQDAVEQTGKHLDAFVSKGVLRVRRLLAEAQGREGNHLTEHVDGHEGRVGDERQAVVVESPEQLDEEVADGEDKDEFEWLS
jgi:hypothetical protein